jgi:hypothetical protein
MGSGIVISLVAIVATFISVLIAFVTRRRRSLHFKQRFGPEYYRVVLEQQGDSRRAEAALANREKRVHDFRLRALSAVEREDYWAQWTAVQRRFVDNPSAAVGVVDRLINRAMTDRGYPKSNFEQRAADISVTYPTVVQTYRAAHEIVERHSDGHAATEELHQAVIYFRSLFEELLAPAEGEFPEPAWDELFAPPKDELLEPAKGELLEPDKGELLEPGKDELLEPDKGELLEPGKDELIEPAEVEEIDGKRSRVTRERAS